MSDKFLENRDKWKAAVDAVSLLETAEIMRGDMDLAQILDGIKKQIWALWRVSCKLGNQ